MLNPANTSFLKVQSERKKGITQKKEHGNNPEVAVMPMELTALHPEQIQTSAEMEKTVTLLEKETIEVSYAKEQLVGADEKEANEVAALAKVIQEQCEGDLAEAMPALKTALLAPDMLNPANTSFLKVQSERKKGITQKKEHWNNPEVAVMPMELTALHPEQIQTSAEMEKTVTLLEKETIEVSYAKEQLVGADEKEANEVAALAKVFQVIVLCSMVAPLHPLLCHLT
ncbi:dynein axonemal heavy chain 7-like [Zootoca vivipara]|uniref:dynein axonemal heavy chain 7-like n=1 Tax=Zootoca vivipara TaxID=8524 RepID=UPI00293BB652|nr:dynein axonemal heavy chain 7-like [Zootoca vivipara]